jgi:hypothetical protein
VLPDLLLLAQADEVVEEEFLPLRMIPCRMCRVAMVHPGQGICLQCASKPVAVMNTVSNRNWFGTGGSQPLFESRTRFFYPALAPTTYNPYIPPRVRYQQYLKQAYQEIEEMLA